MKRLAVLAALLATGCATVAAGPAPVTGNWGGAHVGLQLGSAGGKLDYDCAHGTIGPVILVSGGRFMAAGTHTPEHGGPVRVGEVLPSYPANYVGVVRGDEMTLEGRLENGVTLGPFVLRRGAQPQIFRCL